MKSKEKLVTVVAMAGAPLALWVFGACLDEYDPEACEEQGGTLECWYSDGEVCEDPQEMG